MVNYRAHHLDETFAALSDPTRRAILARLAQGEASVTQLARPFRISLPAISRHLRVLERTRLMVRRRDGRVHRCRLQTQRMRDASEWITRYRRFWESQFDALEDHLRDTNCPPPRRASSSPRKSRKKGR